ncbi:hypothetical protein [Ohtaekwangia sp.]|uniref:hypothetical protein n=1 Tax=Ohtaekwangia sp. TaxID=2066019 RepID=UPI002F9456E4
MANQISPNLPKDKDLANKVIENQNEIEKIKLEQGFLGVIWGGHTSIPNNLAALAIVVLVSTGLIYTFLTWDKKADELNLSIKDFWAIITPLLTLAIGYLFGDKRKNAP